MNELQQAVCNGMVLDGYVVIGKSKSLVNGLDVILMSKGRHTIATNTLGYDEHTVGKSWRIFE